jgi:drug/metabolite transporter (DMT)-like permease
MPVPVPHRRVALVMALSVSAVSTAAILVRLVPTMHPMGIAFWRTVMVAVLLGPTLLSRAPRPQGRDRWWTLLAGLCLALHFWAWFASLQHTTVMRSTVLVCLTPVWAALIGWIVGQDRPSRRFWMGIGVATIGVGVMGSGAPLQGASWLGDGLAVLGGMLSGVYLNIGRRVRQSAGTGPYGALICAGCALWLLFGAVSTGAPLMPPDTRAWWVLIAMALGPQLVGHIGFNYSVKYLPAALIGAMILLEPVGASVLAIFVLDEWPSWVEILGAVGIVAGVGISLMRQPMQSAQGEVGGAT